MFLIFIFITPPWKICFTFNDHAVLGHASFDSVGFLRRRRLVESDRPKELVSLNHIFLSTFNGSFILKTRFTRDPIRDTEFSLRALVILYRRFSIVFSQ